MTYYFLRRLAPESLFQKFGNKQIFETFLKVVRLNGIIEDSRVQAEALEKRIKSEIDTNSELKCQFHEIEAQLHGEKIKRENIESEMKNVHEIRKMFNFIKAQNELNRLNLGAWAFT